VAGWDFVEEQAQLLPQGKLRLKTEQKRLT
jgi:hypothetical protein